MVIFSMAVFFDIYLRNVGCLPDPEASEYEIDQFDPVRIWMWVKMEDRCGTTDGNV